jgi:hypothetical protein
MEIVISPLGDRAKDNWGYQVSHNLYKKTSVVYEVMARGLDKHYLLEERFGATQRDRFKPIGIEHKKQPANERIYNRAREQQQVKLESLKKGDIVEAKGPYGSFTLDESKPAVMLSGGIGITPLRCMIKYATDKKLATKITLFYANRNPEEIAFKKDLDNWQKENKNVNVVYTVTEGDEKWTGLTGYVDEKMIKNNVKMTKDTLFYICGPPTMVDAMVNLLKSMKIDDSRIRIEHFTGY